MIGGDAEDIASLLDISEQVEAFTAKWDLDEKAQGLLVELEPAVQRRVIGQFEPKDTTRGASAAFTGFVRSVLKSVTSVKPNGLPQWELQQFAERWELDDRAAGLLQSLDSDIQARVVRDFAPSDVQKGGSVAFMGFVVAVQKSAGRAMPRNVAGDRDAEQAFIATWDLDASAQEALLRLDPSAKQRIMKSFAPKDTTRGASAAFMGFAKSVTSGTQGNRGGDYSAEQAYGPGPGYQSWEAGPDVDSFLRRWDLDRHARDALTKCDPSVQQRVINDFSPKDVSKGASAAFMGFLKSVSSRAAPAQQRSAEAAYGGWSTFDGSGGLAPAPTAGDAIIDDFSRHWALDDTAYQTLLAMDPRLQKEAMDAFAPRDVSRGASAAFMGFVKKMGASTVPHTRGRSDSAAWEPTVPHSRGRSDAAAWAPMAPSFGAASGPIRAAVIEAFVIQWGLDRSAAGALAQLDPGTQQKVMDSFAPRDVSRGASAAFMGFVKSVVAAGGGSAERGGGGGGGGDGGVSHFIASWELDTKAADALWHLDPHLQQRVMSQFSPKDTSRGASIPFMGFVKSVASSAPLRNPMEQPTFAKAGGYDGLDAFVAQWGLDAKAQDALYRLDSELQQDIMSGFAPKDVSRGASAAFMGFVRSVEGKGKGKGKDKGKGKGNGARFHPY